MAKDTFMENATASMPIKPMISFVQNMTREQVEKFQSDWLQAEIDRKEYTVSVSSSHQEWNQTDTSLLECQKSTPCCSDTLEQLVSADQ